MKVTIERHYGRLRLRWRYQGKRYTMAAGAPDSLMGRAIARKKAAEIELDIEAGYFDTTLLKYRPKITGKTATEISVVELFERFTGAMEQDRALTRNALQKYTALDKHLDHFFGVANGLSVSSTKAQDFTAWLLERMVGQTAKQYLFLLRNCWDWAEGKYYVSTNPWTECLGKVKAQPPQQVQPFSKAEITTIINAFRQHKNHTHYTDFVVFLFGTGVRIGEAAGLRWSTVADDGRTVWIKESISRGDRKSTKTGKNRTIVLSPSISEMLCRRRQQMQPTPKSLVFPSPKGRPIDDHNFRNRPWKTILNECKIEYRKPYTARHSAISHALAAGANPFALAEQTGHDKQVLLSTYAHAIEKKSLFREFL